MLFKTNFKTVSAASKSAASRLKTALCSMAAGLKTAAASPRFASVMVALTVFNCMAMAQTSVGDFSAGTTALTTVADEIAKYIPIVVQLCYALAGVVAILGAISVYIAMNNEEQDVKKKIMMVVGACLFLIAAAQALPAFFGY